MLSMNELLDSFQIAMQPRIRVLTFTYDIWTTKVKQKYILVLSSFQIQLHCYALDCVTHFMFGDGGLDSFGKDFGFMEELTFHHSLQSE